MINVDVICKHKFLSNTYVVGDEQSCIVIDPSNDVRDIIKLIGSRNLQGIFLTHAHFDHFYKLLDLYTKTKATLYLNKNAILKLKNSDLSCATLFGYNYTINLGDINYRIVHDNDILNLDNLVIKIINTPGHTNCGICILIDDKLFTGDTLFQDGYGRFDLPTASFIDLKQSIKRIINLDENIVIYPGHGNTSTICEEMHRDCILKLLK